MLKDGLEYTFKKGEYVKIRDLYREFKWYENAPVEILEVRGYNYLLNFTTLKKKSEFHNSNVIQDEECIKMNRKQKLKKLKKLA